VGHEQAQNLHDRFFKGMLPQPKAVCLFLRDLLPPAVHHALLSLLRAGQSVRLEGLGLIMPAIDAQGALVVRLKPDRKLRIDVTQSAEFYGKVINRQHIGKSGDARVALWNAEHPEDPVE
jgi:hypothetical protein